MAFPVIVKILAILWLTVDLFSFVFTESFPFHTVYDIRLKFVNFQAQQLNHFCCVLPLKVHPIETLIPHTVYIKCEPLNSDEVGRLWQRRFILFADSQNERFCVCLRYISPHRHHAILNNSRNLSVIIRIAMVRNAAYIYLCWRAPISV